MAPLVCNQCLSIPGWDFCSVSRHLGAQKGAAGTREADYRAPAGLIKRANPSRPHPDLRILQKDSRRPGVLEAARGLYSRTLGCRLQPWNVPGVRREVFPIVNQARAPTAARQVSATIESCGMAKSYSLPARTPDRGVETDSSGCRSAATPYFHSI